MKTYCLVIDDDNQEEYFNANVRRVLETDGNEIIPLFIKPTSRKFMKPDHSGLDMSAIVNCCRKKLDAHNVSIVVSDYQIATRKDSFTGVDVMLDLRETHPHVYKILYSATIKDAIKQILSLLPLRSDTIDFDVDDIILNVSGGMIGYFIYYVISKIGDRAPKILRSNIALNLFTSVILGGMLYYIWRLFGL